jgi:hypothetical protein
MLVFVPNTLDTSPDRRAGGLAMSVWSSRSSSVGVFLVLGVLQGASIGCAIAADIDWSVRNRFPFLRHEEDFRRLEAGHMRAGEGGRDTFVGVLEAEHRLSKGVEGANWARSLTSTADGRVCFDQGRRNGYGGLVEKCVLHFDGEKPFETTYVNPISHLVEFRLNGTSEELSGARCEWTFGSREVEPFVGPCDARFSRRIPRKIDRADGSRVIAPTGVTVKISREGAEDRLVESEVAVRDLLIVGMGDSIASGEGNPDRPVQLSEKGFCFRRYLSVFDKGDFHRPSRAKVSPNDVERACDHDDGSDGDRRAWDAGGADWLWRRCHRSMFGYQMRSALALAIRNRHVSVTYVPLGCTGAEIRAGILGEQEAREKTGKAGYSDGGTVESQKSVLTNLLNLGSRRHRVRDVDAVLLSIGANDVGFSGLVADVLVASGTKERRLMKSVIVDPDGAQRAIEGKLAQDFRDLRVFLRSLVGGDLSKVVYTAYANPAWRGTDASGAPVACASGRQGVDVHPAFTVDGEKIARTAKFVDGVFIPALETLATCRKASGSPISANCTDAEKDRMTFVTEHRAAFAAHGFCATAATDPEFDRDCFRASGGSFDDKNLDRPLRCGRNPDDFRTYAKRQRWVRTPNDAYFAAMTYPFRRGMLADPSDLHDAFWGVLTAVYGGAIHPTAEGHAAMADAVVPELEGVLKLGR